MRDGKPVAIWHCPAGEKLESEMAGLAVIVFDETLETRVIVGTVMVVGAALFTLLRARAVARSGA